MSSQDEGVTLLLMGEMGIVLSSGSYLLLALAVNGIKTALT